MDIELEKARDIISKLNTKFKEINILLEELHKYNNLLLDLRIIDTGGLHNITTSPLNIFIDIAEVCYDLKEEG